MSGPDDAGETPSFDTQALAPESAADATVALFADASAISSSPEDSAGDLDDLFADLVQD